MERLRDLLEAFRDDAEESLWDLAVYVGDANREEMPLVSMGPGRPLHDWATLLGQWHLLDETALIARCVSVTAFLVWAMALAMFGWLLWKMLRAQRARS